MDLHTKPQTLKKVVSAVKEIELTRALTTRNCVVCNLPLGNEGKIVRCPLCKNIAHEEHMLEWLRRRDYCPVCRGRIERSQLLEVNVKPAQVKPGKHSPSKKK